MYDSLKKIKEPVGSELTLFEGKFREAMKSNVPLLDRITYYIVKRKGKQIRPLFVFLCAKLCGEINDSTHIAASLVELLHTATLVHDDVVDDADKRRGFFSINALWKNKIAVLVGDYLLSKGLILGLENKEFQLLEIVSNAVKEMSEGELLQIEKARKLDISEPVYYDIIRQKTASLIAAACSAGVASTSDDPQHIQVMKSFGEKIGMAFQIKDDLFDFGEADVGKPRGIDIKEKKMTLPLIYVINKADSQKKKKIIKTIRRHHNDRNKVNQLIQYVHENGGIEYARSKMDVLKSEATQLLDSFPESEARSALSGLVKFVIERKK